MLTLTNLQHQWPNADHANPGLLEGMAATAAAVFPRYGLTTDLTIAHAMAQFSVESGHGTALTENLNYSAARLLQVFPNRFTAATAAQYAHNPTKIAEIIYDIPGLGNAPPPSTDGWDYRGAGLIQITGKLNVTSLNTVLAAHHAGLDVVAHPGLIIDPGHALECGVATFVMLGCLPFAQADDVAGVTKRVNKASLGLAERTQQLAAWKQELGVS